MNTHFLGFECQIQFGQSATRPIEPCCGTLAALLLLAGTSPQRRLALPAHRITAHSGASLVKYAGYGSCQTRLETGLAAQKFPRRRGVGVGWGRLVYWGNMVGAVGSLVAAVALLGAAVLAL